MLTIYYHKDFDGLVAANLLSSIMRELDIYNHFEYVPVDYDKKNSWNKVTLNKPCAIVDFLYHNDAEYYYDHHTTSFTAFPDKVNTNSTLNFCWDIAYKSTPSLLRNVYKELFDFTQYKEIIDWADIIDSAIYTSPMEVYNNKNQYILLNKLIMNFSSEIIEDNLEELRSKIFKFDLNQIIGTYDKKIEQIVNQEKDVMERLKYKMFVENNICFFDQSSENIQYQRYLPYYYFPDIDYTIGIFKKGDGYSISIGYNPWKDNNNIDLGKLTEKYNGGGRYNIAGIIVNSIEDGFSIAKSIKSEINYLKHKSQQIE